MAFKSIDIFALSFLLLLASTVSQATVFDLNTYGAKPNADITQALANAWKDVCAATSPSKLVIPSGTYTLTEAKLLGPCKAPIEVQIQGTLQAPAVMTKASDNWVVIERLDGFTLNGGIFDGQGKSSYGKHCAKTDYCGKLPINIRYNFITNSIIRGITSLDSKQFHMNVLGCNNVTFDHVTVTAPEDSPNTDGIHIGRSTGINITDSNIKTGDDCISLGDGAKQITVVKTTCGPGHGISVGSLGKYPNEEPVEGVFIRNCTLTNTQNGVRIKTWPDSHEGTASDMHFEDIIMNNVGNPILIDQEYCPWNQCKLSVPSKVKLSKVSFKKITGTSSTPVAVKLVCSGGVPCENVEVADVNLAYSGPLGPVTSVCKNVKPILSGTQTPSTCATAAA
ncbi:exopolygalacturonase [Ziziphus jujuba]|uniref:Exopolygalacturonase n=1 Tax=Ziziphus jujuba TaxID=326968 RepID=A0A6P4A5K0_ZIZJJ|nr:exopolygalacturonase [Ziziphus jujuba]